MKIRHTVTALLALAMLLAPALTRAQCDFNSPDKAKSVKLSMVRAFWPCGGITFVGSNTATNNGTAACKTPVTHSAYRFFAKGSCDVKLNHKVEAPCKTGSPWDCANLSIKAKCKDIGLWDTVTPITEAGWYLGMVLRRTTNDRSNGDMTVVDFPFALAFPTPNAGKLKLKTDTNTLFTSLFGPGNESSDCTTFQMISLGIHDRDGNIFAVPGTSSK